MSRRLRSTATLCALAVSLLSLIAVHAGSAAARPRHLIYLSGRIVQEQQSARPIHPEYGIYELDAILGAFRSLGLEVEGAIRPKNASASASADRVVERVQQLLASGVAADEITVVGASMGGGIALLASAQLQNADLRFALLGVCLSSNVRALIEEEGAVPAGHLLSIREASDDSTIDCEPWSNDRARMPKLIAEEVRVSTGLGHGFLYRPLPVWVDPVSAWANRGPAASLPLDERSPARLPDPLQAGWKETRVCERIFESEKQRVLRCTFPPGVGHERHFHAAHFGYALSGGTMRIVDANGTRVVSLATGSSFSSAGIAWHEVVNVGTTTVSYLIVEPK